MSQEQRAPDRGIGDNNSRANGDARAGAAAAPSQDVSKTVIHYRVDLPPCFHGDGKDKESFGLWKTRLELAVKACADGQQLDIATILPTRLSGDALAYWLSFPPEVQKDYDRCVARLNDVFGRKEFLLHFQTFVNARQRLPKEPLEVFAAEITRLVLEAFPNYGEAAISMERFRRFVAGLDPILQSKCHEQGAATLEDALAVACKCERAQEALRLLPPSSPVSTTLYTSPTVSREEPLSAMVSTKSHNSQADRSEELFDAIKQLSKDVQALKLQAASQGHSKRDDYYSSYSGERHRRTPSLSPVRNTRFSSPSYRYSRSHSDYNSSRRSPDHHYNQRSREPSSSPHRRSHPHSYERHSRPRSPERWYPPRGDRSSPYRDYDHNSTYDSGRNRSPSARSGRERHRQYDRDQHVTFSADHYGQGKEW